MSSPIEFADLVNHAGGNILRVVFVLTIVGLVFIIRQPAKTSRKEEER